MLQSGAHVGNRDFEEAKRCAKDETAASRWNVPSEAMEEKGPKRLVGLYWGDEISYPVIEG